MDVESEIRDLKRRVGELEGTYGLLSGQLREVHRAVLGFQDQTSSDFDALSSDVRDVKARLSSVERNVDQLPRALAEIVRAEFERRDRERGN